MAGLARPCTPWHRKQTVRWPSASQRPGLPFVLRRHTRSLVFGRCGRLPRCPSIVSAFACLSLSVSLCLPRRALLLASASLRSETAQACGGVLVENATLVTSFASCPGVLHAAEQGCRSRISGLCDATIWEHRWLYCFRLGCRQRIRDSYATTLSGLYWIWTGIRVEMPGSAREVEQRFF